MRRSLRARSETVARPRRLRCDDSCLGERSQLRSEAVLLDLAGRRLRQLAEDHCLWRLEPCRTSTDELDQLLRLGRTSSTDRHECHRDLSPMRIWSANHRSLEHGRVPAKDLFDLNGGDVLAAGDDDVLGSIPELNVSVRMANAKGARSEPSVPGCCCRGLLGAVVA